MTSTLWTELRYGARALLRDGAGSRRRLRALAYTAAMTAKQLRALQAELLHRTLHLAIARLPRYAHIRPGFPVAAAFDSRSATSMIWLTISTAWSILTWP